MTEWVDPARIRFKISPHDDLRGEAGGDWDLDRRFPLLEAVKHRAITERYRDGRRWEDTELFKDCYRRRFADGESVRGEPNMKALLAQYYDRVDQMFDHMRRRGFQDCWPLPKLLIGRDGEVFIGNQGNHRLAMARVIGLTRFGGEIICRHKLLRSSSITPERSSAAFPP